MGYISIGKFKVKVSTFTLFLGITVAIPLLVMPFFLGLFKQYLLVNYGIGNVLLEKYSWLNMIVIYLPILLLTVLFLFSSGGDFRRYGFKFSKKYLKFSLIVGIIAGIALFVVDWGFGVLQRFPSEASSIFGIFGLILSWGVVGVLAEEILFRGIMLTEFLKHSSGVLNIFGRPLHAGSFIVAGFEALFHLTRVTDWGWIFVLPQVVYVLILSLIANYVYEKTKSLAGPILIHAIGNLLELGLIWLLL